MERTPIGNDDVRRARRAYLGNISYVDDWTGRLLQTLESLGLADDTVVILLADHGDMLGERGLWYKMNFFEGSARIPLIVHAPARFRGRRVSTPVSLVDVLPTLIELSGGAVTDAVRAQHPSAQSEVHVTRTRAGRCPPCGPGVWPPPGCRPCP